MATSNVPSYPVIYVDVHTDGSAHLNIAGRHIDYPQAPLSETRAAITRYAVTIATLLGRPVRMTTSDPDATFNIAVHPNGTVTELTPSEAKTRHITRAPATTPPRSPHASSAPIAQQRTTTAQHEDAAERAPARLAHRASTEDAVSAGGELEATHIASPRPAFIAVLTFNPGATYRIYGSALFGRRPTAPHGDPVDQLVRVNDPTVTLSKNHFRVEQKDGHFWIADLASANGTILQRTAATPVALRPHELHELCPEDVLLTGDITITVTLEPAIQAEIYS
jgi:predicted component of type VI protein secretion system